MKERRNGSRSVGEIGLGAGPLSDEGRPDEARQAFQRSLRYGRSTLAGRDARALVWVAILSLPARARPHAGQALTYASRAVETLLASRQPT